MHRTLAARHWPRGLVCPGSSQLRALQPVQLPPSARHTAKYTFATLGVGRTRLDPPRKSQISCLTSRPTIHVARCYSSRPNKPLEPKRFQSGPRGSESTIPVSPAEDPAQRAIIVTAVDRVKQQILNDTGIPAPEYVVLAFQEWQKAARLATGSSTSQLDGKSTNSDTAASSLLGLDESKPKSSQPSASKVSSTTGHSGLVDHISNAAFKVITHPTVLISQPVLEAYVATQAQLGRPESFPYVLSLYGSKPQPRIKAGPIEYVAQDPHTPAAAVPSHIVDKALDAAIEAKDLDAAVGIVENTYGSKAFQRSKLLKKALVPVSLAAMVPVAVYLLASKLALLQHTYDPAIATMGTGVLIMAYIVFTGTYGMVAMFTHNDQMRRVTYAQGIPLRERWLKEDQRAAFDKIACAFGFSESTRFGEEEGEEFKVLRQFLLRRGLMLDRVELMEGMS